MSDLHIVDVFAREKYAGNQLAVVESGGDLSDGEMQAVADEMNYSETTFVESRESPFRVRIFTPEAEVPFAGHPTLGTAHVIREHVADGRPDEVVLDLNVGEVPVEIRERDGTETLWMTQQPPEFGEGLDHEPLAEVLGLPVDALDTDWPVQIVSTGLPTIIVPLEDREALESIDLDHAAYERVTGDRDAKLVHAVCPEPREADNDMAVRMFSPFYGVPEDPATGSANGCLAAYLARHAYFGSGSVAVRVEQGYEMGRPSLLHLEATDRGDAVDVEVGGQVVDVARGELL
ncbi:MULTISPECIES: PhzF family phenazine biosynthesis protein [Salinibaculum]|uniref:PhzF family phenazine biosynthesis protein n=1 Tax=Salinibaculum TaxID=2732368 RepID=UPI0030D1A7AB